MQGTIRIAETILDRFGLEHSLDWPGYEDELEIEFEGYSVATEDGGTTWQAFKSTTVHNYPAEPDNVDVVVISESKPSVEEAIKACLFVMVDDESEAVYESIYIEEYTEELAPPPAEEDDG